MSPERTDIIIVSVNPSLMVRCGLAVSQTCPNHNIIPIDGRDGYTVGVNKGLKRSTAPYVLLLNDDAEIRSHDFTWHMQQTFRQVPHCACVGVVNPCRKPEMERNKGIVQVTPELSLDGFGIGDMKISFFCAMLSRQAIDAIGLLDEQFNPGYGEDDDWIAEAHLEGWGLGIHTDMLVNHEGGATSRTLHGIADIRKRNEALLREKYAFYFPSA